MFIENADGHALWSRFPFYPLERAAVALRQLTATHGQGLFVKLAYEDRYGTHTSSRDITDQVLAIPQALVERLAHLESSQTCGAGLYDYFLGLGRPAAT